MEQAKVAAPNHSRKGGADMTSTLSVSEHKRGRRHHSKTRDGKPREGTMIRQFYDDLRKGEIVSFGPEFSTFRRQLRDFYGMEIVSAKTDTGRIIGSRLVGEWHGSDYIPVERIVVSLSEPVS